jgi:hypothetical protein
MLGLRLIASLAAVVIVSAAAAQTRAPAPAVPYTPVAIALPKLLADDTFDAMRKQLGEAALRKDRAALARLVVTKGFFWLREGRNAANKRKSGLDNLSAALGLDNQQSAGWEILSGYAEDPTVSPSPRHDGALCAPAEPAYDNKALEALLDATHTAVTDWGYPVSDGIEVHAAPQANAPTIEKLGLHFVRIVPDQASDPPSYMRIATPGGKIGFVSIDSIAPIGNDQVCYVKDGGAWKIGGYVGGGEPQ